MKSTLSLANLKSGIAHFLGRFHVLLFVVFALGGLAIAIFILNRSLAISAAETGYQADSSQVTFDKNTMEDLANLKKNTEQTELVFPAGRINPFVEQ